MTVATTLGDVITSKRETFRRTGSCTTGTSGREISSGAGVGAGVGAGSTLVIAYYINLHKLGHTTVTFFSISTVTIYRLTAYEEIWHTWQLTE